MSTHWPQYTEQELKSLLAAYPNLYLPTSRAIPLLISQLREKSLPPSGFRKLADRIIRILLEEVS
jgi:hypothetical protein